MGDGQCEPSNDNLLHGALKKINKNRHCPKNQQYDMEEKTKIFATHLSNLASLDTCTNVLGGSHHKYTCLHILRNDALCWPVAKWYKAFTLHQPTANKAKSSILWLILLYQAILISRKNYSWFHINGVSWMLPLWHCFKMQQHLPQQFYQFSGLVKLDGQNYLDTICISWKSLQYKNLSSIWRNQKG